MYFNSFCPACLSTHTGNPGLLGGSQLAPQRSVTLARTSRKAQDAIQGLWNRIYCACRGGVGVQNAAIYVLRDSSRRQTFSVKGQIVNTFGFATCIQSVLHSLFFNPLKMLKSF